MADNDAKFFYNKGIIYNEEGKYGLAIDNFQKALQLEPASIEINFNIGVAYINKKEFASAINCFKVVIEKSPEEVAAYSNIALAYARNGQPVEAVENYKKVLELKPDDIPTYKDLGDAYTKARQYDKAIESYQIFLKSHPTSFVVKESLNTAINLKKNASGIQEAPPQKQQDVPQNSPQEPFVSAQEYFNNAVVNIKEQKFDDAIENLRKCLKINSDFPNAYDTLNKLFKIKEKFKNAPAEIKTTAPLPQKPCEYVDLRKFNELYSMAIAYYGVKNYPAALERFTSALEVNPCDENSKKYISEINTMLNK